MSIKSTYRQELKFRITPGILDSIIQDLNLFFKIDSYGDLNGQYLISSLYFDSINLQSVRDKMEGENKRFKARLRIYNEDFSQISLELKKKSGPLYCKEIETVNLENTREFNWHTHSSFFSDTNFYTTIQRHRMRPYCWVTYQRKAFVFHDDPSTRITIDSEIKYSKANNSLSNKPTYTSDTLILEIKTGYKRLEIVDFFINQLINYQLNFSKYQTAINRINNLREYGY